MSGARAELQRLYAQRDLAARAWKTRGGRVVGYVGGAPEALIAAAGLLPYRLSGDPGAGDQALRRYLYPLFNKAQAVRGLIAREQPNAVLERLFSGAFAFVDHLLIVADRKDVSQMLGQVRVAQAAGLDLPPVHFVDRVPAGGFSGSQYNRESLKQLQGVLESWAGAPVSGAALQAAIADWNEERAALGRLVEARRAGRLLGPLALTMLGAGWLAPKREHTRLVEQALAESGEGSQVVRLALVGSPLDHDHVHLALEALGASVVFDGHDWGEAGVPPAIAQDLPPFEAIVEQFNAVGARPELPLGQAAARLAAGARASGAHGAIVLAHRGDTLTAFDAPDLVRALEAEGLPTLHLAEQPYAPDVAALHEAVEPLIARLTVAEEPR